MFGFATTAVLVLGISSTAYTSPTLETRQSGASTHSPPWYPAPLGGTSKSWAGAYQKAYEMVSQMTLLEKINITTGTGWAMGPCVGNTGPVPRLDFPSLCLQDGPLGVRFADKITAFPAGITVGGTWDRKLMRARGEALGAEFRGKGANVLLGPAMGPLGKFPAGGRNWEGFGSDPYLQGVASYESVLGIQSQGVIATAKHWVGNEQEHFRQGENAISSNIDDRTLHEVYMWPFQDSVKAGVGAVMCSYNKINNTAACENSWLQNNVLKDQLGFQGFIMSDWGAQMTGVNSAIGGMDMSMPGDGLVWDQRNSLWGNKLTASVLNGSVPIERVDDMVTRIVAAWYKVGQNSGYPAPNFSSWTKNSTGNIYYGSYEGPVGVVNQHVDVMSDAHSTLARKVAAESIALLKNDRSTLPLTRKHRKIGVYGEDAILDAGGPNVCPDRGCNKGTLASGWGSGAVDFEYLSEPLAAIKAKAATYGATVTAVTNNTLLGDVATSAAKQDVCLVFINADAGEGYIQWEDVAGDRPNLATQKNGDALVLAVANACKNTVVVVHAVGPILVEPWIEHRNVRSLLWAHLPGLESGNALTDVLWGATNPSGKLPYTIGKTLADYGADAAVLYTANAQPWPQQDFKDGLLIDYRHFDAAKITPRFPFGFGLSYTKFSQSRRLDVVKRAPMTPLPRPRPAAEVKAPVYNSSIPAASEVVFPPGFTKIRTLIYPNLNSTSEVSNSSTPYPYPPGYSTPAAKSPAGGPEGGNPDLWTVLYTVSTTVRNTGRVAGAEVVQLYTEPPKGSGAPVRQLRGFEKVFLRPGESRRVSFELTRRDLSAWDSAAQNWKVPSPGVGVVVGSSSRSVVAKAWLKTEA
ncbi:glycoside hydrolase family 3 protein [Geopyxis carbonaria]|nr:glycoside hydrolase family 3 protein [Geopyxis carbonaria]